MSKISIKWSICVAFLCVTSVSLEQLSNDNVIERTKRHTVITDDMKSSILSKFAVIQEDLKYLADIYSQPQARSASSSKCTLSMDKLKQFKDQIDNALTEHDQADSIDCDLNELNPNGVCNEYVKYIQCGIDHLKSAISSANSDKEVIKIKLKYENIIKQQKKLFDDHNNELDQKHKAEIDKLRTDMQELMKEMTRTQNQVEKDAIEIIVEKLKNARNNDVTEAIKEYKDHLDLNLDYEYIIAGVVDKFNVNDKFNLIVNFLRSLPISAHSNKGFDKLMDKLIDENPNISDRKIIEYYENLAPDLDYEKRHTVFDNKLATAYMEVIKKLVENSDCVEFGNIFDTLDVKYLVEDYVMEAYHNISYFEKIIKCFSVINDGLLTVTGLPILYDVMENKNDLNNFEIFEFAFEVKRWITILNDNRIDDQLVTRYFPNFGKLKSKFPKVIREVTWNEENKCNIINADFNEYLHSENKNEENEEKFAVFTKPLDQILLKPWNIKPSFNRDLNIAAINIRSFGLWYKFTPLAYDKNKFNNDNRFVFNLNADRVERYMLDEWIIEPRDNATVFKIKNKKFNEYLYAWETKRYYDGRRDVFTYKSGVIPKKGSDWKIEC